MTARAGMGTLIQQLRAAGNVGTADYTIAGQAYWTDDQLQLELDRTQEIYHQVYLEPGQILNAVSGIPTWQWFDYLIPDALGNYIEQGSTADSGFAVKDYNGSVLDPSLYSINYDAGRITFAADQRASVRFIDAHIYNLNRAAARVWQWKASNVASKVNWSSDNHHIEASQERTNCMDMARYYSSITGPVVSQFYRVDEL